MKKKTINLFQLYDQMIRLLDRIMVMNTTRKSIIVKFQAVSLHEWSARMTN